MLIIRKKSKAPLKKSTGGPVSSMLHPTLKNAWSRWDANNYRLVLSFKTGTFFTARVLATGPITRKRTVGSKQINALTSLEII